MKRIFIFLLSLIMVLSTVTPCFADTVSGNDLVAEKLKLHREEVVQVTFALMKNFSKWESFLGADPDDISYDRMYQVYYLKYKDIVSAYDTNGSFGANITDKYYWVVPNNDLGCEVQVVANSGAEHGWAVRRGTGYAKTIRENFSSVEFDIAKIYDRILSDYPNADTDSFKMVFDEVYSVHLMYFVSDGQEYVLPYFFSTSITWATNAAIYRAGDYISFLRKDVEADSTNLERPKAILKTESIYLNYVLVGSLLVAVVVVGAVMIARSKKDKASRNNK